MADPVAWLSTAGNNAVNNLRSTFSDLTLQKGIRLCIIVFVYLMIRPFLVKWAGVRQMEQHEREEAAAKAERERVAAMSPNDVRGLKVAAELPGTDDDLEAESSATDWGSKARKRQRDVLRKLVDAQEKRLEEQMGDDEDKDIEEFLEKE